MSEKQDNVGIGFNEALKRIANTSKDKIIKNDLEQTVKVVAKKKNGSNTNKPK